MLMLPLAASAETLVMPDRSALVGTAVTVWGATTEPAGTPYTLSCGNGVSVSGNLPADRSYLSISCTYGAEASFTASLATTDATPESDTANVAAFNAAAMTPENLRNLRVNNAIQDGLRNLWVTQSARAANFPASPTTNWGGSYSSAEASLVALAFQNQGYRLPADGSPATGIYEKYVVQRALNWIIAGQTTIALGVTPQGDNPCVGVAADLCTGLYDRRTDIFHQSYTTATASLALAGVGAGLPLRTVAAADVPGNLSANYVVGKTYADVLQRMANSLAWGQIDDAFCGNHACGGWYYDFNNSSSDGSTIGWVLLALLDIEAAGLTVPQWVHDEFADFVPNLNTNGTIDYQSDGNPAFGNSVGPAKNGIGLQGLYFIDELAGARVTAVRDTINSWWSGAGGIGGDSWACAGANVNKGCGYSMYNNFKGLKLQGINTLPNVGRAAGPGAIPANDWYADYVDWFLANQAATGSWGAPMQFSAILTDPDMEDAIALLILSPVALVLPDPVQFGQIGLSHESGSTGPETNPVDTPHTVVATARAANGTGIPGTTINISIIAGPNAGESGSGVSDGTGRVFFTYTGDSGPGTDQIRASIGGALFSNTIEKIWQAATLVCDVDNDSDIDNADLLAIRAKNGQLAAAGDPFDPNGDGRINVADVRYCQLRLTPSN
jgi:hypothetical protein